MHCVNTRLEDLLKQYKEVFTEGVVLYQGKPATFHVVPSVRPQFSKAKTVPYIAKPGLSRIH